MSLKEKVNQYIEKVNQKSEEERTRAAFIWTGVLAAIIVILVVAIYFLVGLVKGWLGW